MILNMKMKTINTKKDVMEHRQSCGGNISNVLCIPETLAHDLCGCRMNDQRRTKPVFITYAETHPIFLPVWVQAVVYCFNNAASGGRAHGKHDALSY